MRVFKFLFKLVLFLLPILLLSAPVLLLLLAVQPLPLVKESGSVEHGDVGRARELLQRHDPRDLEDGEIRPVTVAERDLNLMLGALLPPAAGQRTAVDLDEGSASFYYSLLLPENPVGKYFNLSTHLVQQGDGMRLQSVQFGDTVLPGWLLNPAVLAGDRYLKNRFEEYRGAMAALHEVQLLEDAVHVVYQWDAELAQQIEERGRDFLLPEEDRVRIVAYYGEISRQSRLLSSSGSLATLLQPLFALAQKRSEQGGDPQAENRALFLALGLASREGSLESLLGRDQADLPSPPRAMRFTLLRRPDLSNRFSLAAAITATAGGALANAVGVFKEIDDSRGGSGFSFPDLLADQAGVALAEAALASRAAEIQRFMADSPRESDFMPGISQLSEGLQQMEFKSRFEDLDSASYAQVIDEIESRIAKSPIYR
ncbi:MAG: hypothetical protein O7F73_09980 [Gammaproteobacteria bacterium]|nr:hypothetical protein [Gammaproteobacteria bacterium]